MADISLERIQQMKQEGKSNNEIIETLQRQGYNSTQIFDALSQAAARPMPSEPSGQEPSRPSARPAPAPAMPPISQPNFDSGGDTEELIEAIIDEKWNDLMADINKVIGWKESTESRITKLEQQLHDVKEQFENLHQAIIGKVGEYDQHILDVGAEVKAMEKVFSKVLPVFTDNVAELSRITDKMKVTREKR